jgi:hypothetical protein
MNMHFTDIGKAGSGVDQTSDHFSISQKKKIRPLDWLTGMQAA